MRTRISRDEALSFILTYIIVEKSTAFQLDQLSLFSLTNLASQAAQKLSDEEGLIPHEVIEEIVVVAEKPGFAEKVNEAAVANQVNAAQKLSEDSDGVPEE